MGPACTTYLAFRQAVVTECCLRPEPWQDNALLDGCSFQGATTQESILSALGLGSSLPGALGRSFFLSVTSRQEAGAGMGRTLSWEVAFCEEQPSKRAFFSLESPLFSSGGAKHQGPIKLPSHFSGFLKPVRSSG